MIPAPLSWLATDLLTGEIICDFPSIVPDTSPFRRTLGQYETNNVNAYITEDISPSWERGLMPWGAVLHAYRGAPGSEVIEWSGIVNTLQKKLTNAVQASLITAEGYLDRRYVGNYTTDPTGAGVTKDQNLIAQDLVTQFAADTGGLPIVVEIMGAAGVQRLRTYNDYDDKTVYAALQELMALPGGVEWTMFFQWTHNPDLIVPVLQLGTRLGTPA